MITQFKIFEKIDVGEPNIGDYVVCTNKYWTLDQNKFFLSKIGKIWRISTVDGKFLYSVKYNEEFIDDFPNRKNYGGHWRPELVFWRNEIKHWSKNKKNLKQFVEIYDDIFKYNL